MFAFDTEMLTKKWGKTISLVESIKKEKLTPEKKNALVHALENTQRRVAYKEATNPGNIGHIISIGRYKTQLTAGMSC